MKGKITISYEWWKHGCLPSTPVNKKHKSCLDDHANKHIRECMGNGLNNGVLLCDVNGESYRGRWEIN